MPCLELRQAQRDAEVTTFSFTVDCEKIANLPFWTWF